MGLPSETVQGLDDDLVRELNAAGFAGAEVIGRGGFGTVFRCVQTALDRTVAVKVSTADIPDERQRFLREQRAMGRLTGHPNIVGVLEVGNTPDGYPYLVMQCHSLGSLQARIEQVGGLPLREVLQVGVQIASALELAHGLQIVHRDVKPANILLTDFGEAALGDFGIAHIAGGFMTSAGMIAGSPSFTAPEILSGELPSPASDVYGLGATLYAALTGRAAYERRTGEQVVAQFLRVTTDPVPDLREGDVPDDIATLIEKAMARNPEDRPSAELLGEELRQVQAHYSFRDDRVRLWSECPATAAASRIAHSGAGNLPVELTSFVGRLTELTEATMRLTTSRLVTVAGMGGVGKTRLALRAVAEMRKDFPDGVWFVDLGELSDPTLVGRTVAGAVGLRDDSGRPAPEALNDFLSSRRSVLVLDNCEQVLDEAATLADALLRSCPDLRILTTSRERLAIGGEEVVKLAPFALPDSDGGPTLHGLLGCDAVALFTERAATVVPGFVLTAENIAVVADICSRVDGLPLAIELAAERLRAMSLEQIRQRLADRYKLLTRGSRGAPTRHRTLACSVDWSYNLCTSAEQRLWARLSGFAGSFDLEATEAICHGELTPENVVDLLMSLTDKSILVRTETDGHVRFRLLETLRDYGRQKLHEAAVHPQSRRRGVASA